MWSSLRGGLLRAPLQAHSSHPSESPAASQTCPAAQLCSPSEVPNPIHIQQFPVTGLSTHLSSLTPFSPWPTTCSQWPSLTRVPSLFPRSKSMVSVQHASSTTCWTWQSTQAQALRALTGQEVRRVWGAWGLSGSPLGAQWGTTNASLLPAQCSAPTVTRPAPPSASLCSPTGLSARDPQDVLQGHPCFPSPKPLLFGLLSFDAHHSQRSKSSPFSMAVFSRHIP